MQAWFLQLNFSKVFKRQKSSLQGLKIVPYQAFEAVKWWGIGRLCKVSQRLSLPHSTDRSSRGYEGLFRGVCQEVQAVKMLVRCARLKER